MAAASTDYLTHVGNPGTATTLAAPGHTIAGTAIVVGSTSNWPTDTGVIFAIDTVSIVNGVQVRNAGTYCEFEGIVTSGTDIANMVLRFGTDQNYPAGSTTRVYIPVASSRENRLVDGLLTSLNQDGSLKTNVVTTAKISNSNVTSDKLSTGATSASFDTTESTASATYTNLTTPGPAVTVNIGVNGLALVSIGAQYQNNNASGFASMSFAISGATTQAASDKFALYTGSQVVAKASSVFLLTGLTPGSTTFTTKYAALVAGTSTFLWRSIAVVPL